MSKESKEILESILSPQEINEIQMFLERPALVEAVRKVLFWPIANQGTFFPNEPIKPNFNYIFQSVANDHMGVLNNESLGQKLRSQWEAVQLLQSAFKELESLRKVVELEKPKVNKAR